MANREQIKTKGLRVSEGMAENLMKHLGKNQSSRQFIDHVAQVACAIPESLPRGRPPLPKGPR
jgi:hypothetical protein